MLEPNQKIAEEWEFDARLIRNSKRRHGKALKTAGLAIKVSTVRPLKTKSGKKARLDRMECL